MIIKNDNEIEQVIDWINFQDEIAFDIETTGLNTKKDEIIGFGVSNAEEGFYITHKSWGSDRLHKLVSTNKCVELLNALKAKKLLMWNGSFDSRFTLDYFGVDLIDSLYIEVMLLKHTVDEERPFQLKQVAKKLFGVEATEEQLLMKESIKNNPNGYRP